MCRIKLFFGFCFAENLSRKQEKEVSERLFFYYKSHQVTNIFNKGAFI